MSECSRIDRLPALEAPPVVLASGAHLVGKPEAVRPAFLFGTPAAIPDELERLCFGLRLDLHHANEVGAARTTAKCDALDGQMGFGLEHMRQQAPYLDRWGEALDADVLATAVLAERANRALERFLSSRFREDLFQLSQNDL